MFNWWNGRTWNWKHILASDMSWIICWGRFEVIILRWDLKRGNLRWASLDEVWCPVADLKGSAIRTRMSLHGLNGVALVPCFQSSSPLAFSVTTLQNWSWGQSFSVPWASVLWIPWRAKRESRIKELKLTHCHTYVLATWSFFWSAQLLFLKSCDGKKTTLFFLLFLSVYHWPCQFCAFLLFTTLASCSDSICN